MNSSIVSKSSNRAYIGIGANLGNRHETIKHALERLDVTAGVHVHTVSDLIETEPVGGPAGQSNYLNGAAALDTTLDPCELLRILLEIEHLSGRIRPEGQRNGPRTLDLDLLLYGESIIDKPGLSIPHPRMHKREFVLRPLAQIAPDAFHPKLHQSIRELLNNVR